MPVDAFRCVWKASASSISKDACRFVWRQKTWYHNPRYSTLSFRFFQLQFQIFSTSVSVIFDLGFSFFRLQFSAYGNVSCRLWQLRLVTTPISVALNFFFSDASSPKSVAHFLISVANFFILSFRKIKSDFRIPIISGAQVKKVSLHAAGPILQVQWVNAKDYVWIWMFRWCVWIIW